MNLLGSQKFYVCDSLMHHACEATTQNPRTMLNMMNAAIPPFDNMWIEWDEDERADNMLSGVVSGNVSSRVGWEAIEHPMQLSSNAHSGEDDLRSRHTEPRRPKKWAFTSMRVSTRLGRTTPIFISCTQHLTALGIEAKSLTW